MERSKEKQKSSITQEAFRRPPFHIDPNYNFGEEITRNNFTAAIVDSFAKSMGQPNMQLMYFEWLRENVNANYSKTFENYIKAGSSKILTPPERSMVFSRYKNVKYHLAKNKESEIGVLVLFDDEIAHLAKDHGLSAVFEPNTLKGMAKGAFLEKLSQATSVRWGVSSSEY